MTSLVRKEARARSAGPRRKGMDVLRAGKKSPESSGAQVGLRGEAATSDEWASEEARYWGVHFVPARTASGSPPRLVGCASCFTLYLRWRRSSQPGCAISPNSRDRARRATHRPGDSADPPNRSHHHRQTQTSKASTMNGALGCNHRDRSPETPTLVGSLLLLGALERRPGLAMRAFSRSAPPSQRTHELIPLGPGKNSPESVSVDDRRKLSEYRRPQMPARRESLP